MSRILLVVVMLGLAASLLPAEKRGKGLEKEAAGQHLGQHLEQPATAKRQKAITISVKPFTKSAEPLPQFAKPRRAGRGKGVHRIATPSR
ncbi:MAG TPA: hypothetical protein VEU62_14535 [Bryobacterales bacterium]|nr:hypothetical protein [Bryobacterales bacterium]